jgi:VCBS repeat-containing protein
MKWFQPLFGRNRTDSRESEKLRFESIEPRVLFSATAVEPVAEEVEAHHQPPALEVEDQLVIATHAPADSGSSLPEDADAILTNLNFHAADIEATERREIVFLSTTVEDFEYLLEHLDPAYEVFLIDGKSDGISQIAGALEGITGVDAIHLIGHGNEGRLYLGETVLDAESMLGEHRASLESISTALSPDADLLIYGCDFTAGENGLAAARLLAALTGADVAASTDDTGSEALGGDWDLETTIGTTESKGLSVPTWNGVLAGAAPVLDLNSTDAVTVASDNFSSNNASGGTGWSSNWTKVNDPDGSDVQWTGGTMILREFDKLPSVMRSVDLSGYYNPSITLTYTTSGNLESDNTFRFEYSSDGGANWTLLENFADDSGATRTYSLGTIGTADTVFRASLTGGNGGNDEIVTIDNVSVSADLPNHSASYLTNATPVAITSTNVGITDGDDTHIQSATVTLTNRQSGDLLSVIGGLPSGISASSYNSGTGVLTLSGNATKAQYEAALEQIFFTSGSNVAGNRVINITVNDGTGNSNTAVSTIAVTLDSDGDGVANDNDLDDDGDGILDKNEMNLVTTSSVTTTLSYSAALSSAAPLVNGQPQIILTDGTVTVSITNEFGAEIVGSRVYTDSSSGAAESIRITATSPTGTVFIQGLRFTDLDNFDWNSYVDALALDQLGTWSNLTNTAGGQGLVSYSNDTSGETAATTATGETVSFANLRAAGAVSPVILNPARTDTENNYQATFTLATAVSTLRVFGSDAVLPMNQITEFSFTTFPITYYTQYLEDRDTDGDGTIDRLDIDSDNDGITDNVEAQATASYVAPSGSDADTDGLDDVYDANDSNAAESASLGLTPVDTDADGTADFLDADSDNDGYNDIVERGDGQATSITSTTDTDRDGLLDIFEGSNNNDGYDVNDENLSGPNFTLAKSPTLNSDGSNAIPLVRDLLFRKPNAAPLDGNESNSVDEDATLTVSAVSGVLANATDGDGNTLTISAFSITGQSGPFVLGSAYSIPNVGSITLFANGSYSFTPLPNYNGAVPSVNYTVSDGFGGTDTSVLTLSINPINDAPANVVPGPATTSEDTTLVITGVTVSDVDGGSLTTTISIPSGAGILSVVTGGGAGITGNGTNSVVITGSASQINAALASITYTPTADYNTGTPAAPFNLNVLTSDGTLSDNDNIAITVTPVADIAADTVSTDEDVAAVFNVLTGTSGATADHFENAGRAVTSVTQGAHGSVTFNVNGTITYTPTPNWSGTDSFAYTVTSGGVTETTTVNVSVAAVNDPPVNVVPASQTTNEDTALVITGVTVSDADGGSLTTTLSIPSGAGTLSVVTGGGAGITGNGTNSVVITGSATQINAALASITYTPTADYNTGTPAAPFNVNVLTSDGTISDSDNIAITVTPVADIAADIVSTDEDTAVVFNVLTGTNGATVDTFENGGRVVTSVTQGAHGTVSFNANGELTYTPNSNYVGSDSFTYTVTSGGVTETTTVNISVNATNDVPVNVVPGAQSTSEDTALVITGVSVSDLDGDALTTTLSIPSGAGTLSVVTGGGAGISGNGTNSVVITGSAAQINAALASITYTPTADHNTGTPAVPFTLNVLTSDGTSSDSDNVAVTVTPVADIVADSVTTDEDTAITFNVLTGTNGASADTFENGGRAVTSVTQGVHGTVLFNSNGELTYTPGLNYAGSDSFTYTVTSGGVTETATVNVTVDPVNDGPSNAIPGAQSTLEDVALVITGVSVADVDGDTLTTTLSIPGGAGVLTVLTGGGAAISANGTNSVVITGSSAQINAALASITYTPTADYHTGTPAVPFNLNVLTSDATLSDSDDVAITVTPVADAVDDSVTTNENQAVVFNVLTGTNGASADAFENGGQVLSSVTQGAHGTVTFNANGEITFTPDASFYGTDTFTYTVTSGGVTETATVEVSVDPINDAPVLVVPAAQTTSEDNTLVISGVSVSDVDDDPLTVTLTIPSAAGLISVVTGGGASITGNGSDTVTISGTAAQINDALASITYTPTADFNTGTPAVPINLGVVVSDGVASISDSVAITVSPVADIVTDSVETDEDAAITFNAITGSNGASADSFENSGRAVTSVTQGANGAVTFLANGEITYTPNLNWHGSDSFSYTVTSGGVSETIVVNVVVKSVNDAPTAVGTIPGQTDNDAALISPLNVATFFQDIDSGDNLTYGDGGTLPPGLVIDANTGIISGTLDASASAGGPYTVVITAEDSSGATVTQTFTWTANNPAPIAQDDSFAADEDDGAAVVGNAILNNDSDPDGDALTAQVQSGIAGTLGGLFSIAANGQVTFDTNGDFEALAVGETRQTSFTYTLVDADGATGTATVTVTVTGENDTPVTVGTISTQTNDDIEVVSLNVSGAFGDPDTTDVLTYSDGGTLPPGLTIDPNTGIISGTLDSSASAGGPYIVEITAEDPSGATVTQTFAWTVNNPAPVAQNDDFAADEDEGATVVGNAILNNDSDPDGDALTAQVQTGVAGTQGGLFSIAANGQVTFDTNGAFENLAAGETRQTSFTYTLVDADGATSTAMVTVTVTGENDTPVSIGTIANQTNNDSDLVTLDVSGAFGDPDTTDVLTYSDGGTLPPGLTIDSNTGIISGILDSSASAGGPYTVVITAEDPSGATVTQSFTWTVNNPAPVAQNDDFAADEDDGSAQVGNAILNNDSDPDGDALTAQVESAVAGTQGGLFSIAANGQVTFDTNGEFEDLAVGETRQTSFTYTLVDADGATSTATVTVTVTGENDAPITIGAIANQTNNDSDPVTLDVSGAFGDPDTTDVLIYSDGGTLPPGLVIDANTGIISGTLDSSASAGGTYTVVITAEDPSGATVTQTFTWTVNNPAPVAQDDQFAADEDDGAASVGNAILNNDSDSDGDALTAQTQSGVAGTQGGLFSIAANGQVTFDTNGEFEDLAVGETRQTSFTYTLVDADGATSTATVTVTVTGENDTPVTLGTISNQTNNDSDSVALDVSGAFSDPDATDVLTYSDGGTLPPGLTIDTNTGIISGTLDASASAGGPYTVVITVEDASGATVTQSFTWTVNNPAPVAQNDSFTADEDDGAAVVGNAILNNDGDSDGDVLTAQTQSGVVGTQGGLFSIAANGQVTFDTNGDFEDLAVGETRQTSFTYTLVDADGAASTATVTVTVTGENDAPVTIGAIANQTNDDSDAVTLNVSGAFGDPDATDVLTYSDGGTLPPGLTIDANTGIISGTLDSSASAGGPYTVVITAEDPSGATVTQSFSWTVNNPAPVAQNDDFAADEDDGSAVVGNAILNNDSDPDGDALMAQVQSGIAGTQGGLFSIAANGQVTFDTNGGFEDLAVGETCQTSFTYTLLDADGATSTATVTVTVTGENDTPITVGTVVDQTNNDSDPVTLDVSGAFGDPDATDVLTFSDGGTLPPGLTIDANTGIISGTLGASASVGGPYTVVITAEDSSGATVTQTFTWTVNNPAPVAQNDQFAADEDDGATVVGNAILNNDSDPDGDALSAQVQSGVAGTQGGLFSIAANGQVTFDTNGDFEDLAVGETRQTSFTYALLDADGSTSTATVTVTVTGENDTPITVGTISNQNNNDSDMVTLNVSGAFGDPDTTDALTYSDGGTLPSGLTIDVNTGIISGTLASSASAGGPYTVVITAEDSSGATVTQTFTWTVNNPAPVAQNDDFAADEDDGAAVVGNAILNNDSDPDGDALTAQVQSGVAGTQGGLFSIAANGQVTFDTNGEFEDLAAGEMRQTSFTYTLVDADGATSTATVTVAVTGENDTPVTIGTISNQTNNDSDTVTLNVSGAFGDPDTTDVLTYTDGGTLPPGLTIDSHTGIISGSLDSSASAGGPYTVVITAEEPSGATVTQSFTWTVNNPGPIALSDDFAADEDDGAMVVGNAILNNDSDPDGDALSVQIQSGAAGTQGGLFSIAADGQVTFDTTGDFEDLAVGETCQTSFTYTLVDADGSTSTATVTVTVTGENDTPVTIGTLSNQTNNDSDTVTLNVIGAFGDPDTTDALTFSDGGTLPPGLTIDLNTGLISGTLDSSASLSAPYLVQITAQDGSGAMVTQTFVWTVKNLSPEANNDSFAVGEDDAATVVGNAILNNDSDPDGDLIAAQIQNGAVGSQGGLFSIDANGEVAFDPNGDFDDLAVGETRQTSFTYTILDADGATDTATVTVTVTGVNDTPISTGSLPDQDDEDRDTVTLNVAPFFADPDQSDHLTYSAIGLPPGLSINPTTGVISGTLDSSASSGGPYAVEITVEDEAGATFMQSFVWTVSNPAPVAGDDFFDVEQGSGVVVVGNAIAGNDLDPDGDGISSQLPTGQGSPHSFNAVVMTGVAGSQGGTFAIDANGDVTFDPGNDFDDLIGGQSRVTTFIYLLADADGATTTGEVSVTVFASNTPPVADSGAITVPVGSNGGKLGLEAPADPEDDVLTIQVSKLPKVGVLRLANGKPVVVGQFLSASQLEKLVYDAPAQYRGKKPVFFRYLVSDGQYSTEAIVKIRIVKSGVIRCQPGNFSQSVSGSLKNQGMKEGQKDSGSGKTNWVK